MNERRVIIPKRGFRGIITMARAEKPVKFTRSIFKSGGSYRTTMPMEIIRALKIKETDRFEIWINDSQVILQKKDQP